jgi:hypothetical protein
MAKGKVQITAEQFGEQYVKMFNDGFNSETGETSATINDVAAFFGMKPAVAYQKVVQINKLLAPSGQRLPKMSMSNAERKNRIDLTRLAALAASAKTRNLLSQID